MKRIFASLLVLILMVLACAQEVSLPPAPEPATSTLTETRNFGMGVAGLIPRNHPNSADDDWIEMYESLSETGELFGFYTAWNDSPETEGNIPSVVDVGFGLAPRYKYTPVIALSYFRETNDYRIEPNIDLSNPEQRNRAIQAAVSVAETYHPIYLALGVEVNSYYAENPSDYNNYVSLYLESYNAVKIVSPKTLVFPIFQYENLRGGVLFQGDGQGQPQWDLIEQFDNQFDLIGLTTYPFLLYDTPADLPVDYYDEITKHTSKPVAFTEMGWPSKPLSVALDNPFGGSEGEQTAFVHRFFELTEDLNMVFVMWSFPNDIDPTHNPAFTSVSLRHNDGREKPALAIWKDWVDRKQ